MNRQTKVICALTSIVFLFNTASFIYAENLPVISETEMVASLAGEHDMKLSRAKDPFKPLVIKPTYMRKAYIPPPAKPVRVDHTPSINPISMKLAGICGNQDGRLALVWYKNTAVLVRPGQIVKGDFKVITVKPSHIVVYCNKTQSRQTFSLRHKR